MSLQWYPGHMTKARRELAELMPSQDVVIEVLDARLPLASSNPLIAELRAGKPCVKVLTRSDLADPTVTVAWLAHLRVDGEVVALASTNAKPDLARRAITSACERLGGRRAPDRPVRALITGVPNVGKSTLLNTLVGRPVAKVGDKPAVTKGQQKVALRQGMLVTDSPGLMWPKVEDERAAFRLAFAGSIPDTAIDYLTIAMFGAEALLTRYPERVVARYKLAATPRSPEALLTEVGRRRGGLRPGGVVDLHKAAEVLVHEFRAGVMGPISLEDPPAAA
ncbi:MAG: ribosome biogenesis GTPase YlqF [Kofleriaceae bacterium]